MWRRHLGLAGVALLGLLIFPSTSHANIWDLWWGLSGPQMIGAVLHCEWDLQHTSSVKANVIECRAIDYLFYHKLRPRSERRFWLTLDAGAYTSTTKDSGEDNENKYGWFENHMVAFEPMLEIRGIKIRNVQLHHGLAGVSYDILFGKHFSPFDNAGFKFRPIGVTFPNLHNASFTLRYFPNRFTSEDFGVTNPNQRKDGGEWVWGFTYGWLWKQ